MPEKRVGVPSRGAPSKRNQGVRDQQKGNFQTSQAMTRRVICGYCNKPNHIEIECWRKQEKCLICGSAEQQIASCPSASKEKEMPNSLLGLLQSSQVPEGADRKCQLAFTP